MLSYIAKRLAIGIGTIVFAYTITFLLIHSASTTPGAVKLGFEGTPETIEAENERLGWNRPLVTQYVDGLSSIARLDLGTSLLNSESVGRDLTRRLPVTASIAGLATVVSGVVGVFAGVATAIRGKFVSRAIEGTSSLAISLPPFWVGVILVYVFSIRFGWFPATGYRPFAEGLGTWIRSLVLPVITLAVGGAAVVAKTSAASMRDALHTEHMVTLRAVGTPEWRIRYIHALRAASLPVVAVLGVQFIVLFGGSVIIENLFALPGLGQAALAGAQGNDSPALIGVVVLATAVVVVINIALDLVLAVLDPKLRTK